MKKASEYRQHATECRQLARQMPDDQREELLEMARTWEKLAEDREALVSRHPDLEWREAEDDRPRHQPHDSRPLTGLDYE